ncbi:hypothetical protein GCM10022290_25130 [Sagittula marina]
MTRQKHANAAGDEAWIQSHKTQTSECKPQVGLAEFSGFRCLKKDIKYYQSSPVPSKETGKTKNRAHT